MTKRYILRGVRLAVVVGLAAAAPVSVALAMIPSAGPADVPPGLIPGAQQNQSTGVTAGPAGSGFGVSSIGDLANHLTPHMKVGPTSGCPVNNATLCSLSWRISGPCSSQINGDGLSPDCREFIQTVYGVHTPTLPVPTVAVDAATLPAVGYLANLETLAASPLRPASLAALQEAALARQVLSHMYYIEAQATGHAATASQVQARIDMELAHYPSLSKDDQARLVPPGNDPATYLNSSQMHKIYADELSIGNMRAAVRGDRPPAEAAQAVIAWFRQALSRHHVVITGYGWPTFSLADALPDNTGL